MITLYYLLNLVITSWTLLPVISIFLYHMPLSKKLIHANLIIDAKALIGITYKRIAVFFSIYLFIIALGIYFLGMGALISTGVNIILCTVFERKKLLGKDPIMQQSFLSANKKFFKNYEDVEVFMGKEK